MKMSRFRWPKLPAATFSVLLAPGAVAVLLLTASCREQGPPPRAVFPLAERYSGSYTNDWGAPRGQGKHEGTDIYAPEGTPIRSITGGTVKPASGSAGNGWNTLGGYTVTIRADRDVGPIRRGDLLYYAHMNAPTDLEAGERVEAGQKIGEVGDTGQGPEGTRGRFDPHLHLGWYQGWSLFGRDRAEAPSGAMNPYPLLRWVERNGSPSPGARTSGARR